MTVETAPYINGLNAAAPTGAESKSEGDDHIRTIKGAIKATFPNLTGAVTVTQAELNLLAGLTDVATQADIDAAALATALPGQAGKAGKYLTTDGTNASFESIDLRGEPSAAGVNSGAGALVLNYANGEGQTITATGSFALSATGFPANRLSGILVRAINWGAYAPTSTGITWIKTDNTTTTTFSASGITLPSAGMGLVAIFSYGDGVIYGKAA